MGEMQRKEIGGLKELVILVGILFTVIAGAIGTYWVHSQGVEAASGTGADMGKGAAAPTGTTATVTGVPATMTGTITPATTQPTTEVSGIQDTEVILKDKSGAIAPTEDLTCAPGANARPLSSNTAR